MNSGHGFQAEITLYPTDRGGRAEPLRGGWNGADTWFGCPCKFDPADFSGWDCRILHGMQTFAPGETRRFEIVFHSPEIVAAFRSAARFYLWEGRIIGEARHMDGVEQHGAPDLL